MLTGDMYVWGMGQETIRTRMETYHKQTSPVLEYYKKYGIVRRVVVDGGTPDSVFAQVRPIMEAAVSKYDEV